RRAAAASRSGRRGHSRCREALARHAHRSTLRRGVLALRPDRGRSRERGRPPARMRRARDERARARAPSGAHALAWQRQSARGRGAGGDHHRVAERPLDRQDRGVPLLRAGPAIHGPAISRAHARSRRRARGRPGFPRDGGVRQRAVRRLRHRRGVRGTRARHRAEEPMGAARSHVLIRRGRVREGLARLEAFLPLLATCGRPIHCHDAWHLALLHLEELDVAAAMRVFKAHIWGITPDFVVEQLDAIALLWRIEMAAGPTDAQWPAIAEHIAPRAVETFMPFMNAHYVYALARAGRADAVEAVLARVRARSAADDEEAKRVWAPVGRAVIEAAAAFGAGDRARAAALLDPVMPMMT